MSIKLRRSIYHADVVVNGQRVRATTGTSHKADAQKFERNLRHQVETGTYSIIVGGSLTLRAAFDKALNEHWIGKASESTVAINAKAVCAALGNNTPLVAVDSAMLWKLKTALRDLGNSPATINRKMSCVHTLLTLAYRSWGVLKSVPYVKQEEESEGRTRIITPEEQSQGFDLLLHHYGRNMASFFMVLVDTGLRLTEGLHIGVPGHTEMDCTNRALRVWKSKGGKPRSVPMTQTVLSILDGWMSRPFTFTRYQADEAWNWMKKAQGITDKEYTIHCLRHTFASRLVQAGVPLYVVQQLLGHASITTTERYAHLDMGNYTDAIKALQGCGVGVLQLVSLGSEGQRFPSLGAASPEAITHALDLGSSGETRGSPSLPIRTTSKQ